MGAGNRIPWTEELDSLRAQMKITKTGAVHIWGIPDAGWVPKGKTKAAVESQGAEAKGVSKKEGSQLPVMFAFSVTLIISPNFQNLYLFHLFRLQDRGDYSLLCGNSVPQIFLC